MFVREGQEFEINATGGWYHDAADPAFANLYSPAGVDLFNMRRMGCDGEQLLQVMFSLCQRYGHRKAPLAEQRVPRPL